MTPLTCRAPLAAAAIACLFSSMAHAQTPAAASPWSKVPALPTACYDGSDGFAGRVEAGRTALQADIERQKGINGQIEQQFNNIDPMEKAQRMQQWMMSNPQEAARVLGAQQQATAAAQAAGPEITDAQMKFSTERKELETKYAAALKQARAPSAAKYDALDKRLSAAGCGFGDTECAIPPAAYAERDAILRERDAAYQANCAKWWTAAGPIQDYAKRYRAWLTQKWLPSWQANDDALLSQYAIMNTPAASWKSTIPSETVDRYLGEIAPLYALRDDAPTCTAQGCPRH